MTDPRGVRNNNALNIDYHANNPWQGLDTPPSDGRFARFKEPQWGIRAAIKILESYQRRGIDTVREIVFTWAPPVENHSENYLGFVCRKACVTPETHVDLNNKDLVIRVLKAMELMENGEPKGTANGQWLDDLVYDAGYSLARPLTQSRTARGSAIALISASAGAVVEVAQDIIPQAADAATIVTPIWPEIARWVLIAVCIAGGALAFYARWQAKREGIR